MYGYYDLSTIAVFISSSLYTLKQTEIIVAVFVDIFYVVL